MQLDETLSKVKGIKKNKKSELKKSI